MFKTKISKEDMERADELKSFRSGVLDMVQVYGKRREVFWNKLREKYKVPIDIKDITLDEKTGILKEF